MSVSFITSFATAAIDAAVAAGTIRTDVKASELVLAGMRVAAPASDGDIAQARRMVALPVDGVRFGAARANRKARHAGSRVVNRSFRHAFARLAGADEVGVGVSLPSHL
jgi:hypothetical protein